MRTLPVLVRISIGAACCFIVCRAVDTFICPDGTKSVQCLTNPCEVTQCERYPYARCEVDYCGRCKATFIDNDGSVLDCCATYTKDAIPQDTFICPDGTKSVQCPTNPCEVTQCERYPYARCEVDYCGGCIAKFIDNDGSVLDCADKNRCTGSSHSGHCRAMLLRWYFDQSTGTCEPFIYSGCGGNRNRFWSKWKCKQKC
ncbi:uncharacterized protein LOC102808747 [Saccoglossus kowalevskii]